MVAQPSGGDGGASRASAISPIYPPPQPSDLSPVLERNILALQVRRRREQGPASAEEKIAGAITRFTGSMMFVYLHLSAYLSWVIANLGWIPGIPRWDPS